MAVREGRWDCSQCGTRGQLGRDTVCSNCGKPRPEGVTFYLRVNEPAVADTEMIREAQAGADWVCLHCGGSTRALFNLCSNCGAERGSSPSQSIREYEPTEIPRLGDEGPGPVSPWVTGAEDRFGANGETTPVSVFAPLAEETTVPGHQPLDRIQLDVKDYIPHIRMLAGTLVFAFLVWCVWFFLIRTEIHVLTVTGHTWSRSITIEEYRTVREEGWSVPIGGRELNSEQRLSHYIQVLSHYETKTREVSEIIQTGTETYMCGSRDLGNGYFEDIECSRPVYGTQYRTETYQDPVYRQEPVYATWYTWDIERWIVDRQPTTRGNSVDEPTPYWPQSSLGYAERENGRFERYRIHFLDEEGRELSAIYSQKEWSMFEVGEQFRAQVTRAGIIRNLDPIGK